MPFRTDISGARSEMKKDEAQAYRQSAESMRSDPEENVTRVEEEGEAGEPDAPTAEEENAGMNTVLTAEPLVGVQDEKSEK
jgi:hypothetical protein